MNKEEIIELLKKKFNNWSEKDYMDAAKPIEKKAFYQGEIELLLKQYNYIKFDETLWEKCLKEISEIPSKKKLMERAIKVFFDGWSLENIRRFVNSISKLSKEEDMVLSWLNQSLIEYKCDDCDNEEAQRNYLYVSIKNEKNRELKKSIKSEEIGESWYTDLLSLTGSELLIELLEEDLTDEVFEFIRKKKDEIGLTNKNIIGLEILKHAINDPHYILSSIGHKMWAVALEGIGFDQRMIEKIQKKLEPYENEIKGLLHLKSSDKNELKVYEILLKIDALYKVQHPGTAKAYRLSQREIESMSYLRKMFEEQGFKTERFPEIYEDQIALPKSLQSSEPIEIINNYGSGPLGRYVYSMDDIEKDYKIRFTNEGYIIIDKDRIRKWSKVLKVNEEDVCFVVLMHELGHWLTHWSVHKEDIYFNERHRRWNPGYELDNPFIHESLANIIAYWACTNLDVKKNSLIEVFEKLSPKNKLREINTSNPYGAYKNLIKKDSKEILKKLYVLRNNWMIKDSYLFDYLSSDFNDIKEWLGSRSPEDLVSENLPMSKEELKHRQLFDRSILAKDEQKKGARLLGRSGIEFD